MSESAPRTAAPHPRLRREAAIACAGDWANRSNVEDGRADYAGMLSGSAAEVADTGGGQVAAEADAVGPGADQVHAEAHVAAAAAFQLHAAAAASGSPEQR